jgi:adenylate cyclase
VRVQRSFAFVDLAGFSSLTATEGDERAVGVLVGFRAVLRQVCSRRGVRIAKWLGDGAMLVSVEPPALVQTVLELVHATAAARLPTPMTCGATTGAVLLLEGDDYVGHAVNVAARLCDLAGPEEVLAERQLASAVPPWGEVEELPPMSVRGLADPLEVVRLRLRPTGPEAHRDPICGLPLLSATAAAIRQDAVGRPVLLCSASCLETWEGRPAPTPEEQGSLRSPFIGS